ncbi:MAG TPA: xanthine dehydrogenase family protein molybdopterin-binding subunit, partial [Actinomycetes bacterium]|nr:xanthine dehydrogenase family protein molybdopterin-binding subunit [Actinomycetes bacterium]
LAIVRSPHASARVLRVGLEPALALPGVLAAVDGEEVRRHTNPIPEGWDTSVIGAKRVDWYALAAERVRYAGEAVAAVVATDRPTALRAAELVQVDYRPLPAVTDAERALRPGSPLVEPGWGDNLLLTQELTAGDVEAAMRRAHTVVRGRVSSQRVTGVPIEPRGILASYDRGQGRLTFWESTQQPHQVRSYLAQALGMPEAAIHVVQPHVGGAFGLKQPTSQEEVLLAYLAVRVGRPLKWIEERFESLAAGGHARETSCAYQAAVAADGLVTAMRVEIVADVGAPTAFLGWGMSLVTMLCVPTVYRVPDISVRLRSVVTNKCPWTPYRGFGKDVATLLMERVMDHVADRLGACRVDLRLRNLLGPREFPYRRPSGAVLDSGDYPRALRRVVERAGASDLEAMRAAASARGRRLGLGVAMELTPEGVAVHGSLMNNGYDGATVRISPTGEVSVLAGVTTPGTGNETALAQIAADALGCGVERVRVVQGDTDTCPWGLGNYSSRSVIIGGSAVALACGDLRAKLLAVAASMLGTTPEAVAAGHERFSDSADARRSVGWGEVVRQVYWHGFEAHAEGVEPALEATRYWRIGNIDHQPRPGERPSMYPTWASGAVACLVEVDPATGLVELVGYHAVEDAGRIVNPLLAEANLHGAIAQAVGGALYERLAYDPGGQLVTGTLMDYTIPTAVELPGLQVEHQQTPSPFTPLGTKGVGESGMGGTPAAICAAVEDAFPELELRLDELPLTPARVWHAIRRAGRRDAEGKERTWATATSANAVQG